MIPIEIPLSKSKLTLMLVGCIAFVALGLWMFSYQPTSGDPPWMIRPLIVTASIAATVFFGFCGFLAIKKLNSPLPGLIINNEGITNYSSGLSAGPIPWKDILEVKTTSALSQSFILIMVSNPQEHIDRQPSAIKRKAMTVNYKTYGTPVCISANGLKSNFNDLYRLLTENLRQKKSAGLV